MILNSLSSANSTLRGISEPAIRIIASRKGFTLVETMVVLAIAAILATVSIASINGARSTYARQEATSSVIGAVERARVAAVQSGANVYVVLALPIDNGTTPDQVIVVGDPPLGSVPGAADVCYTKWMKLPQNVRLRSSTGTLVANTTTLPTQVSAALPPIGGSPVYASFCFNGRGQITSMVTGASPVSAGLVMAFFEGVRNGSTTSELAQGASASATLGLSDSGQYDLIRLSRYDGRAWQEVGTLQTK